MQVKLQLEAQLREIAGATELTLELPEQEVVSGALKVVATRHGQLQDRLFHGDEISPSVMIFVNDQPVARAAASDHQLNANDLILLLPPISGG